MIKAGRLDRKYGGIGDCFKRTIADEGIYSCGSYFTHPLNLLQVLFPYGVVTLPTLFVTSLLRH